MFRYSDSCCCCCKLGVDVECGRDVGEEVESLLCCFLLYWYHAGGFMYARLIDLPIVYGSTRDTRHVSEYTIELLQVV